MLEEVQPVCVGIDPLYLPVGDRRSLEASRDARWASPVASPAAGTSVSDALWLLLTSLPFGAQ